MNRNALTGQPVPELGLVGPTAKEDISRLIARYGVDEVTAAIKEATKKPRGRKPDEDWPKLKDDIAKDVEDYIAGRDPFQLRTPYSIAKRFAAKHPGHNHVATHKRVAAKLGKQRKWMVLIGVELATQNQHSWEIHLEALADLANLKMAGQEYWINRRDDIMRVTIDYQKYFGVTAPKRMSFEELKQANADAQYELNRKASGEETSDLLKQWLQEPKE